MGFFFVCPSCSAKSEKAFCKVCNVYGTKQPSLPKFQPVTKGMHGSL